MRNFLSLTLCLFLLVATSVVQADDRSCASTDNIDQIKAYLLCQNQESFAACSGLAAAVTGGLGGSGARSQLLKIQLRLLTNLEDDLASRLHDEWRANRLIDAEKKLYEPRIKVVEGVSYDIANLNYSQLPEPFQKENRESARVAVSAMREHLIAGGAFDSQFIENASEKIHDEWVKRNFDWAPPEQKLPFTQLSQVEADKDRDIIRKAISMFDGSTKSTGGKFGGSVLKVLSKLGPRSALVTGGVVGLAALGLSEAVDAKATGCDTVDSQYMNQDREHSCRANLTINQNVAAFLDFPPEKQQKLMREHPAVCAYYRDLHEKLLPTLKTLKLSCRGKLGATITGTKVSGDNFEYRISRRSDGSLAQISSFENGKSAGVFGILANGHSNPARLNDENLIKTFNHVKLYAADADACCRQTGAQQSACVQQFQQNVETATSESLPSTTK